MFSATMPPAVERITRKYLRRPAFVSIGEVGQTASTVEQNFVFCSEQQKKARLQEMLRKNKPPVMVSRPPPLLQLSRASKETERIKEANAPSRAVPPTLHPHPVARVRRSSSTRASLATRCTAT